MATPRYAGVCSDDTYDTATTTWTDPVYDVSAGAAGACEPVYDLSTPGAAPDDDEESPITDV